MVSWFFFQYCQWWQTSDKLLPEVEDGWVLWEFLNSFARCIPAMQLAIGADKHEGFHGWVPHGGDSLGLTLLS